MKTIATLLLALLCVKTEGVLAQVEIYYQGALAPNEILIDDLVATDHNIRKLYVTNSGTDTMYYRHSRSRLLHEAGWTDLTHDNIVGFDPGDVDYWISPAIIIVPIPPGHTQSLSLILSPNGIEGCATYLYHLVDENDQIHDSITVYWQTTNASCPLGLDDYDLNVNVYSNANGIVISGLHESAEIELYDLSGKVLKREQLNSNFEILNCANLQNRVLLYSIITKSGKTAKGKLFLE